MHHLHRLLDWLVVVLILCTALPAVAGGGGGGGGTKAVSVPTITPVAFVVVQGLILAGYVLWMLGSDGAVLHLDLSRGAEAQAPK